MSVCRATSISHAPKVRQVVFDPRLYYAFRPWRLDMSERSASSSSRIQYYLGFPKHASHNSGRLPANLVSHQTSCVAYLPTTLFIKLSVPRKVNGGAGSSAEQDTWAVCSGRSMSNQTAPFAKVPGPGSRRSEVNTMQRYHVSALLRFQFPPGACSADARSICPSGCL